MTFPLCAIARMPTPLLNCPHFKEIFHTKLPLDHQGLLKETELIAFPGTKFQVLSSTHEQIWQVRMLDYEKPLFTDRRFLTLVSPDTLERPKILPSSFEILETLIRLKGVPYVWGGNWHTGIPEMLEFYPPSQPLDPFSLNHWTFKGVDCSGLLYEATRGYTPRNTSTLVRWGESVPIEGLSLDAFIPLLKPLDLIVWVGHVVVIFDANSTIESWLGKGVILCPLKERFAEILQQKVAVNTWENPNNPRERFVIRRWHPEYYYDR